MTTMEMIRNLIDIKNTEPEPDLNIDEPIKDLFKEGKRPYKGPPEKISASLLSEEISRIREEQRRQAVEDLLDDLFEEQEERDWYGC